MSSSFDDNKSNKWDSKEIDNREFDEVVKAKRTLLVDDNGDNITNNNPLSVTGVSGSNSDFPLEVGKGNIDGYLWIFNTGNNDAVTVTGDTIRGIGGRYPFPTTAAIMSIVSSDVNDTLLGTGAQKVLLTGLDSNYDEQSEIIELNGTTPVSTTLSYLRINGFLVIETGSDNINDGNIDVLNGTDNLGRIEIGESQMRQAVATVPRGKSWIPYLFLPSCGKDDELLLSTIGGNPNGTRIVFSKQHLYQNNINLVSQVRLIFAETFDFEVVGFKTGAAGIAKVSLMQDFLQIDNDKF